MSASTGGASDAYPIDIIMLGLLGIRALDTCRFNNEQSSHLAVYINQSQVVSCGSYSADMILSQGWKESDWEKLD